MLNEVSRKCQGRRQGGAFLNKDVQLESSILGAPNQNEILPRSTNNPLYSDQLRALFIFLSRDTDCSLYDSEYIRQRSRKTALFFEIYSTKPIYGMKEKLITTDYNLNAESLLSYPHTLS